MAVNPADLLARYLRKHQMTQAQLARKAKITEAQVSRLLSKQRRPSVNTAHAIETATEGEVPARAWVSPSFPEAA